MMSSVNLVVLFIVLLQDKSAAQPLIVANNVTATEGETAILRCSVGVNIALYPDLLIYLARETPLTVSANNRYTDGDTTGVLEIVSTELTDGGEYYCLAVAISAGFSEYTNFFLVVTPHGILSITVTNITVELNEPANLICSAELAERVKDQNIEVSITISNTLGSNFESTQINDTAVLQIPNTTLSDEGVYLCTIVVEEEIVTANFTLKVQYLKSFNVSADNVTAPFGNGTNVTCGADVGEQKNEIETEMVPVMIDLVRPGNITAHRRFLEGNYTAVIEIFSVDVSDQGLYICYITIGDVAMQRSLYLTVNNFELRVEANFSTDPYPRYPLGDSLYLTCNISYDRGSVEWQRNGKVITGEGNEEVIVTSNTSISLNLPRMTFDNLAIYSCVGTYFQYSADSTSTIIIDEYVPPYLTAYTNTFTFLVGEAANLVCGAAGIPRPTVYWRYKGQFLGESQDTVGPTANNGFLVLSRATIENSGEYFCDAIGLLGENKSQTYFINIIPQTITISLPTEKPTETLPVYAIVIPVVVVVLALLVGACLCIYFLSTNTDIFINHEERKLKKMSRKLQKQLEQGMVSEEWDESAMGYYANRASYAPSSSEESEEFVDIDPDWKTSVTEFTPVPDDDDDDPLLPPAYTSTAAAVNDKHMPITLPLQPLHTMPPPEPDHHTSPLKFDDDDSFDGPLFEYIEPPVEPVEPVEPGEPGKPPIEPITIDRPPVTEQEQPKNTTALPVEPVVVDVAPVEVAIPHDDTEKLMPTEHEPPLQQAAPPVAKRELPPSKTKQPQKKKPRKSQEKKRPAVKKQPQKDLAKQPIIEQPRPTTPTPSDREASKPEKKKPKSKQKDLDPSVPKPPKVVYSTEDDGKAQTAIIELGMEDFDDDEDDDWDIDSITDIGQLLNKAVGIPITEQPKPDAEDKEVAPAAVPKPDTQDREVIPVKPKSNVQDRDVAPPVAAPVKKKKKSKKPKLESKSELKGGPVALPSKEERRHSMEGQETKTRRVGIEESSEHSHDDNHDANLGRRLSGGELKVPSRFTKRASLEESQLAYLRQLSTSISPNDVFRTDEEEEEKPVPRSKSLRKLNSSEAAHLREPTKPAKSLNKKESSEGVSSQPPPPIMRSHSLEKRPHRPAERDSVVQRSVNEELQKGEQEAITSTKKHKQKKSKKTKKAPATATSTAADVFY